MHKQLSLFKKRSDHACSLPLSVSGRPSGVCFCNIYPLFLKIVKLSCQKDAYLYSCFSFVKDRSPL